MTKYFCWVPSSLGPIAQIWYDKQTDGNGKGKDQVTVGKPVALADEDARSIEELKRSYPYE